MSGTTENMKTGNGDPKNMTNVSMQYDNCHFFRDILYSTFDTEIREHISRKNFIINKLYSQNAE